MALFPPADRRRAEVLSAINETNPFATDRVDLERRLLGRAYIDVGPARARSGAFEENPNSAALCEVGLEVVERARRVLETDGDAQRDELERYEDVAVFTLYHEWFDALAELARASEKAGAESTPLVVERYPEFRRRALELLRPRKRRLPSDFEPAHLFALFFQVSRAFRQIHSNILGTSTAAVGLRRAVWQSIFTHDIRRYQRSVYRNMRDIATLVTGPSGTGKELVARAVGLSGYLPFDEKRASFPADSAERFLALNLSALAPTLIESELFGHKRGAFTGALGDRRGWFEVAPAHGAVFLDEIGDVSLDVQVKLLRVLQTRIFQRLGDTTAKRFRGKVVSATNRDLEQGIAEGTFREDLYYRLCSDRIVTPGLAEQINGSMDELRALAFFIARDLIGDEAPALADEVVELVEQRLGRDYAWPGNFRELEQCVRNVLVRREYRPHLGGSRPRGARASLAAVFTEGSASADAVLRAYCTLVYAREGSYDGAARVLGLDRRTVRAKVDDDWLARLREDAAPA